MSKNRLNATMKQDQKAEGDEPLGKVLREWSVDKALPPRFQEEVWRRIEQTQERTELSIWAVVAHWVSAILSRPAMAVSYMSVLVAIGVTLGWAQAQHDTARAHQELGQRYVRVLDPYLAPRP